MKITVWGCRGSTCVPGAKTLRYGGNTTCVEIRTSGGLELVVDAGSGLRNLGQALLEDKAITDLTLLFTHAHWDHLMGFPFFKPAYLSRYKITLCGGPVAQNSVEKYLTHQMEAPFFPVDFNLMKARFITGCQCATAQCAGANAGPLGPKVCQAIPLNHPNGGYGFKFADQGKTFVFLTDNELSFHHEGGFARQEYVEFCRGADLLFHDAQYTDAEYELTRGWGHSTYADAIRLAQDANVKRLGLFHHDPDRTDDELDAQVAICRQIIQQAGSSVDCFAVAEGMVIDL